MDNLEKMSNDELIDAIKSIVAASQQRWLRTNQVCEYLSISSSQLQVYKNEGYFAVRKLGGTNYYDRQEIDEVMEKLGCEV
ncbi:helix-turn-helix domain-containing protein [Gracilimonas sediminicola]|uniref:helix-turn-helix domain-containing protein n=1 Tax=Gracilimonas sediminicola TaxID=2952158 RepID=UPI0038D42A9B